MDSLTISRTAERVTMGTLRGLPLSSSKNRRRGITWPALCKLAMKLPGVEQGTSYGTPSLHVKKKFLARLKEDEKTVALRVDMDERDVLLELDPDAFYVTDHYRPYPAMLVRLEKVRIDQLEELLEHGWRLQAPKRLVTGASKKVRRK